MAQMDFSTQYEQTKIKFSEWQAARAQVVQARTALSQAETDDAKPESAIRKQFGAGFLLKKAPGAKAELTTATNELAAAEEAFANSFQSLTNCSQPVKA